MGFPSSSPRLLILAVTLTCIFASTESRYTLQGEPFPSSGDSESWEPVHVTVLSTHPPQSGRSGSTLNLTFTAFGHAHHLTLVENGELTSQRGHHGIPVVVHDEDGVHVTTVDFRKRRLRFYHDVNSAGAFAVGYHGDDNNTSVHLEGILPGEDHDVIVKPMSMSEQQGSRGNHVVWRRKTGRGGRRERDTTRSLPVSPTPGSVTSAVEMVVWMDNAMFEDFRREAGATDAAKDKALVYVATTVNAADRRYKFGITDPSLSISLHLTGIIICQVASCSDFLEHLRSNGTRDVDNHAALDALAEQLSRDPNQVTKHFHYDHVTVLTRLDLVDPQTDPIGVSFADEICNLAEGKSTSLVEDRGAYSSAGTVAHELAHNLGSDHDGWGRSVACPATDGYIMSALSPLVKNGFFFSQCSVNSIKANLMLANASCVKDKPRDDSRYAALNGTLPGKQYTTDQQCKALYNTSFCLSVGTHLEDICYKMWCWDPMLPNVCSTKSPAALGTACGNGKWCIGGECVPQK